MRKGFQLLAFLVGMAALCTCTATYSETVGQWEIDEFDMSFVEEPDFFFVVLTDTHVTPTRHTHTVEEMFDPRLKFEIWGRNNKYNIAKFEKIIRQINLMRPAFVVHLGDIVTSMCFSKTYNDEAKNALELIKMIEVPFHLCPGNHDVGNKRSKQHRPRPGDTSKYYVCEENEALYRGFFGDVYQSWDCDGCHFIALNVEIFNTGLRDNIEQMKWLRNDLERNKDAKRTVMFGHRILFWNTPRDMGFNNYEVIDEPARGEMLGLIENYGVAAMYTGHTHHSIRNRYEGAQLLTVPSAAFTRNSWNIYPDLKGGNHDPGKIGYFLVRVYGDKIVTNMIRTADVLPDVTSAQEGTPIAPARVLTKQSAEAEGCLLMVDAPIPEKTPALWGPSGINDGLIIPDPRFPAPTVGWTAPVMESATDPIWVQIELDRPRKIDLIVLYSPVMPEEYVIETSPDGTTWREVASQNGETPRVPALEPQEFTFPAHKARYVRVTGRRVSGAPQGFTIMEMEVYGTDGVNYALVDEGGFASANVAAGRSEGAISDNAWTHSYDLANRRVRISPVSYTAWENVERRPGTYRTSWLLDRALTNGIQENLKFQVPLSLRHPLYRNDDMGAFKSYCRFMARTLGDRVSVWELPRCTEDPTTGHPVGYVCSADEYIAKFNAMRDAITAVQPGAQFAATGLSMAAAQDTSPIVQAIAGKVDLLYFYPPSMNSVGIRDLMNIMRDFINRVREVCPDAQLGLLYRPATVAHVPAEGAADIARMFIQLQNEGLITGLRLRGGHSLLDPFDNPRNAFYAIRALATFFDEAPRPVSDAPIRITGPGVVQFAYRRDDGSWMLAAWNKGHIEQAADMVLPPRTGSAEAIDVLTSTVQKLRIDTEGNEVVAKNVVIKYSPTLFITH